MLRRSCLAFAFSALLAAAAPALAQTPEEMVGTYRMRVEPEPGGLCQPGETTFEVIGFDGRFVDVVLDGTRTRARWDAGAHSFDGLIPFPDDSNLIQLYGEFSRGPEQVNLMVAVTFPPSRPCRARLTGSRPAAPQAPPPVSPTAPPVFGVAPQAVPPAAPPLGPASGEIGTPPPELRRPGQLFGIDIKLLAGGAILLLVIGALLSLRKPKPPSPPPAKPEA